MGSHGYLDSSTIGAVEQRCVDPSAVLKPPRLKPGDRVDSCRPRARLAKKRQADRRAACGGNTEFGRLCACQI